MTIRRELLRLAWPLALANVFLICDAFVVRYWLGHHYGSVGLAVHTATAPVVGLVHLLFIAIATGAAVGIARSVGARDGRGLSIACNAMTLVGVLAVVIGVATVAFSTQVSAWIAKRGMSPEPVAQLLESYVLFAIPLTSISIVLTTTAASAGWGRLSLIWGVTHVPPVFALMPLALGPLGLGYRAPAFAVAVAAVINAVTLWAMVRRNAERLHLGRVDRALLFDRRLWRDALDIGLPQQLTRAAAFAVLLMVVRHVASAGVTVLAGYGIAMIYVDLAGSLSGGFARATGILMAQSLGAKNPLRAREVLTTSLWLGALIPAATIALLGFGASFAVAVFAETGDATAAGIHALRLMVFVLIPASLWQILLSAFGAAKATKRSFLIGLAAQAVALAILATRSSDDRVVDALITVGAMHTLSVVGFLGLSVPVLWRGVLAKA
jgi:Na+-driven multidrug efflux pump